mmetsp:Transcript_28948/g.69138  ORF Transcript_28948/g.69138 Transcript_28948/m.69138 type:complete len:579 (+) Transcript_28948:995-2731(+)
MGRCVMGFHSVSEGRIDLSDNLIPDAERAGHEATAVDKHVAAAGPRDVGDLDDGAASRAEDAAVPDLPAALRVEGRGVEHELDLRLVLLCRRLVHCRAAGEEADHAATLREPLVAHKGRSPDLLGELPERLPRGEVDLLAGALRAPALGLHLGLKPVDVHRDPGRRRRLGRDLEREPKRVVQEEGVGPAEDAARAVAAGGLQELVELLLPALQRLREALLLAAHLLADPGRVARNVWVARAAERHDDLRQAVGEEFGDPENAALHDDAPEKAPDHVAAADVGRKHAVGDEVHSGAAVVADDLEGGLLGLGGFAVVDAGEPRGLRHDGEYEVRLVVVRGSLEDLRHALEAHARVDVLVGERRRRSVLRPVELHENHVVELDEPRVVLEVGAVLAALGVQVVVELGARPARPRRPARPEVVLRPHAPDPRLGHADLVPPDGIGLVVLLEDAHPDTRFGEAKHLGGELPAPLDGLALEVVAKGEVAEHLEEGVVARGDADVLDVVGPDALLRRRRPRHRSRGLPEEDWLELQHPRDGQQHRRVLRHEAGAREPRVAPLLEEREESFSDLGPTQLRRRGTCC